MAPSRFISNAICLMLALLFACVLVHAGAVSSKPKVMSDENQSTGSMLVRPLVKFSGDLFKQIRTDDDNLIVSPLSLHRALNLVLLGADEKSDTQEELINVLGYEQPLEPYYDSHQQLARSFAENKQQSNQSTQNPERYPVIDIWDLFVLKDVKLGKKYASDIEKHFELNSVETISRTDTAAKSNLIGRINDWGKKAGFESDLLKADAFDSSTAAALFSAIKAQSYWFKKFHEGPKDMRFNNFGSKSNLSPAGKFMYRRDVDEARFFEFCQEEKCNFKSLRNYIRDREPSLFDQLAGLNIRAVKMPLEGKIDLIMLEPTSYTKGDELRVLAQNLSQVDCTGTSTLAKILTYVDMDQSGRYLDSLTMPKFKFESDLKLTSSLKAMCLSKIFQSDAQLNSIIEGASPARAVYVDSIEQKAVIDVDEFGIKAAAITKIEFSLTSISISEFPIHLTIQNPFIFMLRYEQVPLFMGQLVKI